MKMQFLLFILGTALSINAHANRCGTIAVDLETYNVTVAAGRCAMQESYYRAVEACQQAEYSSGQCVSANMQSDGTPYGPELSHCGGRYIIVACKFENHRPYCRTGCAGSPSVAVTTALQNCRDSFSWSSRGCSLSGRDGTDEPWDITTL